ncbi:hypothetical protein I204_00136 [Kwoniella mangroviensis CBS 8886]|uniref:uncharacterized protein n=1 Tax=Kwoniella mangroviensis CBS 8507 TaxID=1296122 RepID=UPI00080D5FF9|nr:uncharacterized protein I203_02688 [Kwoniella mangroviensis CBS 8507]OCF68029.1 hypothetical protein I203_02688 [Kwoniella mangroviensis CBS 8507]OCF78199.1 hypothetical protein I204_00136 [Kwoniella mangroviensis CBS 8886]
MFSEESKSGKNHTDVRSRAAVSDETREASQGTAENTSKDVHDGTQTSDDGDTHGTYPKVESIPEPHQAHTRSTSGPDDSFFRYGYSTRFTGPTDNKFFSEPRLFGCAGYRSQSPQMSYTPGAGGDSHGSMKPFGPGAVAVSSLEQVHFFGIRTRNR